MSPLVSPKQKLNISFEPIDQKEYSVESKAVEPRNMNIDLN